MYNDYEIANILLKKEEGKILASKEYFHSDLWMLCYSDLFLNALSKDSYACLVHELINIEEYRQLLIESYGSK